MEREYVMRCGKVTPNGCYFWPMRFAKGTKPRVMAAIRKKVKEWHGYAGPIVAA